MILVNIESLSLSELRNIAEQEGISDSDVMDRDELVEALQEKYEEEDDAPDSDTNTRYLSGITDFRGMGNYVEGLPGVVDLPDDYADTEIHLVLRNCLWAYCYWTFSQREADEIADNGWSVYLAVTIMADGRMDKFEVPTALGDSEWNLSIPYGDGWAEVSLVSGRGEERRVHAVSSRIQLIDPYWIRNRKEMKSSDMLYRVYLSMLTTKEGAIVENQVVEDIVELFREEDIAHE